MAEYFTSKEMGSMRNLKAAYRLNIKKLHPDVLFSGKSDVPLDEQKEANRIFVEMQAEYEELCKWRERVDKNGSVTYGDMGMFFKDLSSFMNSNENFSEGAAEFTWSKTRSYGRARSTIKDYEGVEYSNYKATCVSGMFVVDGKIVCTDLFGFCNYHGLTPEEYIEKHCDGNADDFIIYHRTKF